MTGLIPAPETRTEAQRYSHAERAASLAHRARQKAKGNGFGFLEIKPGRPAPTLTATFSFHVAPRFIDKHGEHWAPSCVELNRIQSFPDDFHVPGSYTDHWKRLGNSVPPLFMRAIALHVRDTILSK